jgi:hypothetical protein
MTCLKTIVSTATVLATSLLCTHSSSGQDALGSGNALDANLSPGGRTNSARPQENYRDRNLIITGDVAGGRGFRGSVGYTAASDFRGDTGSNDIFPFLADSAYSSPALFQLGSTYEQLRFGQAFGSLEFRRSQSGAPASVNAQNPVPLRSIGELSGSMTNYDRLRLDRTSIANSTAVNLQSLVEPQIVGLTYNKENRPFVFNASSLRGITLEPMNQSVGTIGLSTLDSVRLREDAQSVQESQMVGVPFEPKFEEKPLPGQDLRVNGTAATGRLNTASSNAAADYNAILARVAERYAQNGQASEPSQLQGEFQNLRDQLRGGRPGAVSTRIGNRVGTPSDSKDEPGSMRSSTGLPTENATSENAGPIGQSPLDQRQTPREGDESRETTPPSSGDERAIPPSPLDRQSPTKRPGDVRSPDRPSPGSEAPSTNVPRKRSASEMANVLRHGQRVERLSSDQNDRFNELLSTGETRLREADYFVAERTFDRALRFSPDHPMAMAGMGHAQLGGGLYLSAALTLRTLLTEHPEMIDAMFAADLLPSRERLNSIVKTLKTKLEEPGDKASYGFLLAYIGHQLADRPMMQHGIAAMAPADTKDDFMALLRELWLTPPALRETKPAPTAEPEK